MVVFRNGTIVSQKYVIIGGKGLKGVVYDRKSGKEIINFTAKEKYEITKLAKEGKQSLKYSDLLNNHNLLRFYTPKGFKPVDPSEFDYLTNYIQMENLRYRLKNKSTALITKHRRSTTSLYKTDAAELKGREYEITTIPESVSGNHLTEKENKSSKNHKKSYN